MARGESGRIVLEIDPSDKDELYSALSKDGVTLKAWFLRQMAQYIRDQGQMPLFEALGVSEKPTHYKAISALTRAAKMKTPRIRINAKPK